MIKVIGGDHGRGSIALSGGYRVREGDEIELYYDDPQTALEPAILSGHSLEVVKTFQCVGADSGHSYESALANSGTPDAQTQIMPNHFAGASCAGLILGTGKRTWVDESIGAYVSMK